MERPGFLDYFDSLEDPRSRINLQYSIEEILLVSFSAIICGSEEWSDVESFGKCKEEFFKQFLPFPKGIPSDDTFRRFYRSLDPKKFQKVFINWVKSFIIDLSDKVVAIDGKTSRRSHDGSKKALHLVSAFVSEARVVLGQQKTEEKSNEINANLSFIHRWNRSICPLHSG